MKSPSLKLKSGPRRLFSISGDSVFLVCKLWAGPQDIILMDYSFIGRFYTFTV